MNRQDKQLIIDTIKNEFAKSQASIIINAQGLNVESVQVLKKTLAPKGAKIRVAKNTLLKIATAERPEFQELTPFFKNQIAIVFSSGDASEAAKIISKASEENANVVIIAGTIENKVISKDQVRALASLPSKEILLARLCGTLNAPTTKLAATMNQFILRLVWVLKQISEKQA